MTKIKGDKIELEDGDKLVLGNNDDFSIRYDAAQSRLEFVDDQGNEAFLNKGDSGDLLVVGADHGSLGGLTDDDHPQYTLADGSRPFTGDIDLGGNSAVNIGGIQSNLLPLEESIQLGLKSGGTLSRGSGTRELDISSGLGFTFDKDTDTFDKVDFDPQTITVPSDTSKVVSIDSSGTAQLTDSPPDLNKNIVLASVVTDGDSIVLLANHSVKVGEENADDHFYAGDVIGPIAVDGGLASVSGSSPLGMDVTATTHYIKDFRKELPGETDITFTYWYRDGSGGWNKIENQTEIDTTKYDDGSGTLANIPAGEWKQDVLYIAGNDGNAEYHVVYAQKTYADQDSAEDGEVPNVHKFLNNFSLRSTGLVSQEGSTSITSFVDQRPFLGQLAPQKAGVTDHGNLGGLSNDDHTQYIHRDGRRSMTGDFDLGSNSINNIDQVNSTRLNSTQQPIEESMSRGWVSGGDVTRAGGLDIDVSSGAGFTYISGDTIPISWSQQTISIPSNSDHFVYVDNTGTVQSSDAEPSFSENIVLANVRTDSDTVTFLSEHKIEVGDHRERMHEYTEEVIGPLSVDGVLASQGSATQLSVDVSGGNFYILDDRKTVTAQTNITWNYWYRDGSGGWNVNEGVSQIDTEKYDDGSGTLADIPVGEYKKDVLFVAPTIAGPEYHVVYAQETHADETAATDSGFPNVHSDLSIRSLRSTGIVVQDGDTSLSTFTDERPFLGQLSTSTSVTDHGNLSGLSDDDHSQYLLVDGTRAMTGSLDLGGNDLVSSGVTIWDESNGWISQGRLENDSITINAGDGLKGGGTPALGGSATIDIEPVEFAGLGLSDDGSDNLEINDGAGLTINSDQLEVNPGDGIKIVSDTVSVEPADFAGAGLSDDGADDLQINAGDGLKIETDNLNIEPNDFAGSGLSDDGADNLQVNAGEGIEIVSDDVDAVWGQDYTTAHSTTVQSTAGVGAWTDYISITPPTPGGTETFRLNWNLVWYAIKDQGARFRLRNKTDGTTVGVIQGSGDDANNNRVKDEGITYSFGMANTVTLSASKQYAVQYINHVGAATQEIREAHLEYYRIA